MKSCLISIKPKWCGLIASGKKTIEVRKTAPKEVPFKGYIYCTIDGKKKGDRLLYGDLFSPKSITCGMVIGEFMCDEVFEIGVNSDDFGEWWHETIDEDCSEDNMCLTFSELDDYLGYQHGFGWHITNLKIYDEPKELSEFKYVKQIRSYHKKQESFVDGLLRSNRVLVRKFERPPQSWFYCEELDKL